MSLEATKLNIRISNVLLDVCIDLLCSTKFAMLYYAVLSCHDYMDQSGGRMAIIMNRSSGYAMTL